MCNSNWKLSSLLLILICISYGVNYSVNIELAVVTARV